MTPTSNPAISVLGRKAEDFFRTYRAAGLKAVEDAARKHDDVIDVTVTQSASYVAGSWRSKFGPAEARNSFYQLAALTAAVGLVALNAWGIWLAWSHFGFETIPGSVATIATTAVLGLLSFLVAVPLVVTTRDVTCNVCLAVSFWTRGWTPVSMEWFGSDAGATWGLGSKNIYIWQKPYHGWGNPDLRVIRYQDIQIMVDPTESRDFLHFCLDYNLPQPLTEWLRFPEATNGMSAEQIAGAILDRATRAGRAVELFPRRHKENRPDGGIEENTLIQIIPPASCWKLLF